MKSRPRGLFPRQARRRAKEQISSDRILPPHAVLDQAEEIIALGPHGRRQVARHRLEIVVRLLIVTRVRQALDSFEAQADGQDMRRSRGCGAQRRAASEAKPQAGFPRERVRREFEVHGHIASFRLRAARKLRKVEGRHSLVDEKTGRLLLQQPTVGPARALAIAGLPRAIGRAEGRHCRKTRIAHLRQRLEKTPRSPVVARIERTLGGKIEGVVPVEGGRRPLRQAREQPSHVLVCAGMERGTRARERRLGMGAGPRGSDGNGGHPAKKRSARHGSSRTIEGFATGNLLRDRPNTRGAAIDRAHHSMRYRIVAFKEEGHG
jgi:hypothetical protein